MWGKVKIELAIWRLALRRAWPQVRAVWGRKPLAVGVPESGH
jgi:hypothetical protein